jgi:hypothetical protein
MTSNGILAPHYHASSSTNCQALWYLTEVVQNINARDVVDDNDEDRGITYGMMIYVPMPSPRFAALVWSQNKRHHLSYHDQELRKAQGHQILTSKFS